MSDSWLLLIQAVQPELLYIPPDFEPYLASCVLMKHKSELSAVPILNIPGLKPISLQIHDCIDFNVQSVCSEIMF